MRTVIMAGGKGTRISSVASDIPKPLINICAKPVLEWQLLCLKKQGINNITIVVGHLGRQIQDYFGNGSEWGVSISYLVEDTPLGTAGALSLLKNCKEDILLINGDLCFDMDIHRFYEAHKQNPGEITLVTHPNSHPADSTIIVTDDNGKVTQWIKKEDPRGDVKNRVNAGIHLLSPAVLQMFGETAKNVDLDRDVIQQKVVDEAVYVYDTPEYMKDMGTPERYAQVCRDMACGLVQGRNLSGKQKAVFLDRDGTINVDIPFLSDKRQMELLPEAADAIAMLNQSEYLVIIVTNQPVIARGECTLDELKDINNHLETLLGAAGAYVNDIFVCPHHPDRGFPGERIEYKTDCSCRKPKPGLLYQAAEKYNIDLQGSYLVGDKITDYQAGINAGCHAILAPDGLTCAIAESILKNGSYKT